MVLTIGKVSNLLLRFISETPIRDGRSLTLMRFLRIASEDYIRRCRVKKLAHVSEIIFGFIVAFSSVVLTTVWILLAGHEEELGAQQRRDILPHRLAFHQRRAGIGMVTHHAAAQAVVAFAGEAFAPQKAGIAGALVRHVLALGVDALDEELERAHVVAGDQDARGLFETLAYQGQRQGRRGLTQICATRLFLAVVWIKV